MLTVTFEEAKAQFDWIFKKASEGEEIVVSEPGKIAILIKSIPQGHAMKRGRLKHWNYKMAEDFDAPLDEMKEYDAYGVKRVW